MSYNPNVTAPRASNSNQAGATIVNIPARNTTNQPPVPQQYQPTGYTTGSAPPQTQTQTQPQSRMQQQQYPPQFQGQNNFVQQQQGYFPHQQQQRQPTQHQQYYQQYQQQQQQNYVPAAQPQQQQQFHNIPQYGNQQYMQQNPYGQNGMNMGANNVNYGMQPGMPSMHTARRKVTLKLVILGNSGVGKTSLMNRYHSNKFTGQYKATIGADFLSKQLSLPTNTGSKQSVTLTIWDTAGQERFQSLGKAFYRGSDACILVYDVTDRNSFDGLAKWKEEFESCLSGNSAGGANGMLMNNRIQNGSVMRNNLKFIVVANKADKDDSARVVQRDEGMAYAASIGGEFYECSAKTAMNVEKAFVAAAKSGLEYNNKKQMSTSMMHGRGGPGGMRGYVPPQRTVDLNRGNSSMADDGDCC